MKHTDQIVIVSFSSRAGGNCAQIARLIQSQLRSSSLFSFAEFELKPCGRCGYECFSDGGLCPHRDDMEYQLLDFICASSMTYFIVPNYCDFPCANLFIFNERSVGYFHENPGMLDIYMKVPKRFIVVSSGQAENLRSAFMQHTEREPDLLILSAGKYGRKSTHADLMNSDQAKVDLQQFLELHNGT